MDAIWYGEREDESRWANDLNTTIQQLHAETVCIIHYSISNGKLLQNLQFFNKT